MRAAAITFTCMAACAVSLAGPLSRQATADDNPAHALADKFARAAQQAEQAQARSKADEAAKQEEAERARLAAEASERRKAEAQKAEARRRAEYEADMLRRASAEAEARREADQRAFEEQARREAEQEQARIAAEQENARLDAEQEKARADAEREKARIAAEQEKVRLAAEQERARAEAARLAQEAEAQRQEKARRAEQARKAEAERLAGEVEEKRRAEELAVKAEEARKAEAARLAKQADEKRVAEERAAEERRVAEEARARLERMRMEEARRIAEKFRLAREARERERGVRNSLGGPPPPPEMDEPAPWSVDTAPANTGAIPSRVTVLLLMQPKRRGFSGTPGAANPVLCLGRSCYISAGPGASADRLSRRKTLGPANSIGRRAGPCRRQLGCVFRNVDLGGVSGAIQPIDMGLLRHDRRDIKTVRADRTCEVIAGNLFCATPIVGHRYRAWIVPETMAATVGPRALERALAQGLPAARSAEREDWLTNVQALPTR